MKIRRIFAHRIELPLHEGSYKWSGGKSVTVFDSTIVGVETDSGLTGYGEVCPLGPFYLPAYAEGVRAGLRELAPHLIGFNPLQLQVLNHRMDAALKGHPYVKSGIDIACWDLLGKACNLPVCELLGGRFGDAVRLYRAISQEAPEVMAEKVAGYRSQGYSRFQLRWVATRIRTLSGFMRCEPCCRPEIDWWRTPTPAGRSTKRCAWCEQ